jgi:hypothetical protein
MRTSIWKALKRRGEAIRTALNRYNKLAAAMNPPAPVLDWKDVVNYTFISEFDMLRHTYSRSDITQKPWALQANREVSSRYFKIVRAQEELTRLNVEMQRLRTGMVDEQRLLEETAERLEPTDAALAAEIHTIHKARVRVNRVHMARINTIMALPGYTGPTERGVRLGATPSSPTIRAHTIAEAELGNSTGDGSFNPASEEVSSQDDGIDADLDDGAKYELTTMGNFIEDLAAAPDLDVDVRHSRQGIPIHMLSSFRL